MDGQMDGWTNEQTDGGREEGWTTDRRKGEWEGGMNGGNQLQFQTASFFNIFYLRDCTSGACPQVCKRCWQHRQHLPVSLQW